MAISTGLAQQVPAEVSSPSYLLRLERMQANEDVCVLVRGDGQYHFERLRRDQDMDIFESSLALPALQNLEHTLNSDELLQLSQEKISTPLISSSRDELLLSILRLGRWQNLTFPVAESRQPFRQSLDPLLKWLGDLPKENHIKLTEESGRNNCLPPEKIELKTRAANSREQSPGQPSNAPRTSKEIAPSFALRLAITRFSERQLENNCVIIYSDGRYHMERKRQRVGSNTVTTEVLEDSIPSTELQQLKRILDDPALQKRRSEDSAQAVALRDGEFTFLSIPRDDHTQKLVFWKYYGAFPVGLGGMPSVSDNGVKLIKPLNQWLKSNIDDKKMQPLPDARTTKCEPSQPTAPQSPP
ncbi:MAG: hypothetical protein LAN63_14995 [Acidobacteriia bacterium]|nr:hypothetical protein [Terriglobia bacterium]